MTVDIEEIWNAEAIDYPEDPSIKDLTLLLKSRAQGMLEAIEIIEQNKVDEYWRYASMARLAHLAMFCDEYAMTALTHVQNVVDRRSDQ